VPKVKKILLYEMKFLVPSYSCLQNPWLRGYRPQIPFISVLCPQLNLLNPPTEQNSWVRHWIVPSNSTGHVHMVTLPFPYFMFCTSWYVYNILVIVLWCVCSIHKSTQKYPGWCVSLCGSVWSTVVMKKVMAVL